MSFGENTGLFLNSGFTTQMLCDKQFCRRRNACFCAANDHGFCCPPKCCPKSKCGPGTATKTTHSSTSSCSTTKSNSTHSSNSSKSVCTCVSGPQKAVVPKDLEQQINLDGHCENVEFGLPMLDEDENWEVINSCYRIPGPGIYQMNLDILAKFVVEGQCAAGAALRITIEERDNPLQPFFRRTLKVMLVSIEDNTTEDTRVDYFPLSLLQCLRAECCPVSHPDSLQVGHCLVVSAQVRNPLTNIGSVSILGRTADCGEGTVFEQLAPTTNIVIQRVAD